VAPDIRLGADGVTRRFGAVVANDGVTLSVAPGTVHAIVGENGAGKTTLMRILYGLDRPDAGTVVVDDEPVRLAGPADAARRGIGMVHQELKLVGELTLLENLVLGREPRRGPAVDWAAARRRAEALGAETGIELDWDQPAARAPVSARQRLEILRLLHREADVLILDEPTAVLAPPQVAELLRLLRGLRDGGRTIVFISHKLREVLDVADTVTALRGGRVSGTVAAADADPDALVRMMVGEAVPDVHVGARATGGAPRLSVRGLCVRDAAGRERLRDVSLDVRAGEVVGVAGVAGNGQDELVECVVGLLRPTAGAVAIGGRDMTRRPVAERRRGGLAYIPADRRRDGLSPTSTITENAVAGAQRTRALTRHGWFRPRALERRAQEIVERSGVRCESLAAPAGSLSGGNQQRLILGRELQGGPVVVVASQPTRGVDVRGAAEIRRRLLAVREAGGAVLLVSEELDELAALCDRIVVLAGGSVAGEVPGPVRDLTELGRLMTARGAAA
jgi:general nucleoside transport system ATP-binding protein